MTTNYGLTGDGFELKRLPEIKTDLENSLGSVFGAIDTSPESVFGQLIGVLSKPLTDLWEQLQTVYFSQYPDTAEGVALDYAARLTGITRRAATYSYGKVGLKGTAGSDVPQSTQFETDITKYIFQTTNLATVQNTGVARIYVNVENAEDGIIYIVTVNGVDYPTAPTPLGSTKTSIALLIYDVLTNPLNACSALLTVKNLSNGALYITSKINGVFTIDVRAEDGGSPVADRVAWYTPAEITAANKGNLPAPAFSIVDIVNPVTGLDEVVNFEDVTAGLEIETDAALRLRRAQSLAVAGAGTVEAIRSRILDPIEGVQGVSDAYVFENDKDYTFEGRDPHSIEVVVNGGDEQEIADFIWKVKAAGIKTVGAITRTVFDSMSIQHAISFSRPLERPVWLRLDVTKYTEEGLFPSDGADQIVQKLLEYGKTVTIGKDLIYQRLYPPIFEVPGIASVELYTALPNLIFVAGSYAHLSDLFNYFKTLKSVLVIGDTFVVNSVGDTGDGDLATAKGSAVVLYDVFTITNVATPAIAYVDRLNKTVAPYGSAYGQVNIAVAGTEIAIFDEARINVNVV